MTDTQLTLIIGFGTQVLTGLGIIANQFFQGEKADRALRDRELQLREAHTKLDDLRNLQVENTRETKETGTKAVAAFKEANDVNLKMLDIKQVNKEKLDRIDAVTTDTNSVVQELKQNGKT